MTDTAPPEQILTEAADKALSLAQELTGEDADAGTHLAYLAGLIRGGITNLAIAYDRGWDEGYDEGTTPIVAPAAMAAVWQGLNTEQRAVVCIVSPELAGMLDAAEDPAPVEVTESEMGPPPYWVLRLREALGRENRADDTAEVLVQVAEMRDTLDRYRTALLAALGVADTGPADDVVLARAVGVIERAQRAAHAWAGTGEPGTVAATALQDLVHYLDERAA
jgi:hypothetical protein